MDTFPQAQSPPVLAQSAIISSSNPIQESPRKKGFRKFLNISSWIFLFALLPITVLIFLSQNTIPGDLFYPVKRSLENVILAAASVSPATRAAFRTDLTTTRFDEAEKLLLASYDIRGLEDFITEIQAAQSEVSSISNLVKKQELQKKIQTSVIEYEERLNEVKVQLTTREQLTQLAFTATPTIEPTTLPFSTNTPVPVPTAKAGQPLIPTNTSVPLPTSTLIPPKLSESPTAIPTKEQILTPTPMLARHTPTQVPTALPKQTPTPIPPIPTPTPPPSAEEKTIGTVDKVQEFLRCLQNTKPPHKECAPPEISSSRFNSENHLERRDEEKSEQEGKPEKIKENSNEDGQEFQKRSESEESGTERSDSLPVLKNEH